MLQCINNKGIKIDIMECNTISTLLILNFESASMNVDIVAIERHSEVFMNFNSFHYDIV